MKKIISITILPAFLLFSCGKTEEVIKKQVVEKKYAKIETVKMGNFSEELKLTGKIAASRETVISAQIGGIVKQVNYKVGDKVNAKDVLAIIDDKSNLLSVNLRNITKSYTNTSNIYTLTKESIQKDLDSAKVNLENAKISRDNTYKTTNEQLKIAQTQLDNINITLNNTQKMSDISLDLAKKSLQTAQINLDNFEKNYTETIASFDTKKKNLLNTISSNINSSLTTIDSALTYADILLGVSDQNKHFNDSYEMYLGAKNSTSKTNAENDYRIAKTAYDNLINSNSETLVKFNELIDLTDKVIKLYEDLVIVADNTITSSNFPETSVSGNSLNSIKTNIKSNQSAILGVKSGLVSLQNSFDDLISTINSTKTNLETQRTSLNQALKIAEINMQNTIASINTNLDSVSGNKTLLQNQLQNTIASIKASREAADNAVKIAENNYNSIKAKLEASLASTKNQLDSVLGQRNQVLQQIDNTLIKAPFSGIITSKNIEIGQMVQAGAPAFSISSENSKVVKFELNADNIKFVKIGQEVIISKNNKQIKGYISLISKQADSITKMYKCEASFDSSKFENLVLGDYVDVFLKKQGKDDKNLIVIPFSSLITSSNGDFFVYTVGSGSVIKATKIKIGDSNSSQVVVTDGLKVGDKIVVEGTLNLSEGDVVEE